MRTLDDVTRDAVKLLCDNWATDQGYLGAKDCVRLLSAAGLLATSTMIECAEACMAYAKSVGLMRSEVVDRLHSAGRAHAATLVPPAMRYEARCTGGSRNEWGVYPGGRGIPAAYFYLHDAEAEALEWAARKNAGSEAEAALAASPPLAAIVPDGYGSEVRINAVAREVFAPMLRESIAAAKRITAERRGMERAAKIADNADVLCECETEEYNRHCSVHLQVAAAIREEATK